MSFGGYRLLTQTGAGRDGVSYRAVAPDDVTAVEVRDLSPARADPVRWPDLARRVRLAALIDHPGAVGVVEHALEGDPPFVVVTWVDGPSLAEADHGSVATADALAIAQAIASALAEAHRFGLAHGRLAPRNVRLREGGRPVLDFIGIGGDPASPSGTGRDVEDACRAPETAGSVDPGPAGREADLYALGVLLVWLLTGKTPAAAGNPLQGSPGDLLRAMLSADPADRPTAREVENGLEAWARLPGRWTAENDFLSLGSLSPPLSDGPGATFSAPAAPLTVASAAAVGLRLGRFRLMELLGSGGQGVVYRAEDTTDGSVVALKVLRPEWAGHAEAARRFRKEARMLAEVNNPYVVNLLEFNEDGGVVYLVMEYVTGRTLAALLSRRGRLDEATALSIASGVARALEDAHGRGIVHRDVKPANILLPVTAAAHVGPPATRVKLTDFGLARHVVDADSMAMTAPGAVLGTPHYMAPEQSTGRPVDPRTDVYALGATLFHMLAGKPPFDAETREQLHALHGQSPLPALKGLNPALSDGICGVVERALAKSPADRYPDAAGMRRDLEKLARGEPTGIPLHPVLPACDPKRIYEFEFRWELASDPRQLWPHVTNTDRLDRALGFAPVTYAYRADPGLGVRQFAEGRQAGIPESWEEHPYEWVEPRRMAVLREYTRGPFHWLVSAVELSPRPGGGTTLVHRLRLEPRGWKSRLFSRLGVGVGFRNNIGRLYERIDAALTGKLGPPASVDPFEAPPELTGPRRERLDARLDALALCGTSPAAVERLGDLIARGSAQDLARLHPVGLARRWGLDPEPVLATCLRAAKGGLLVLLWDILCPSCRVSCAVGDTLRAIREHGRCEACRLDFDLDFASSVELIFRVHPEVREADTGLYCAGGPAHAPHVLAQVRVAAGEVFELELNLPEASYRLRGPQLPWSAPFRVQPSAATRRADVDLVLGPGFDWPRAFASGGQVVVLVNPGDQEVLVRLERESVRDDALTAAQALAFAPFRDLFPGEVLSPDQLISVAAVTLLVTDLDRPGDLYDALGDARAFNLIHEHFRVLDEAVRLGGGTLVKTVDEGIVASFRRPEEAVKVGLDLPNVLARRESTRGLGLRVGVHRGPAVVATLDGRLDYFGASARRARHLLRHARANDLILTREVAGDPGVAALLLARGLTGSVFDAGPDNLLHRFATPLETSHPRAGRGDG